jgi:hypothetical protein
MNRKQILSKLQLPMELIDMISSYESYDLFDYYGMKKTCPIIQQIMQTKKDIHILLSKKRRYHVEQKKIMEGDLDLGTEFCCEYSTLERNQRVDFSTYFCGECGNYFDSLTIGFVCIHFYGLERIMCKCYPMMDDFSDNDSIITDGEDEDNDVPNDTIDTPSPPAAIQDNVNVRLKIASEINDILNKSGVSNKKEIMDLFLSGVVSQVFCKMENLSQDEQQKIFKILSNIMS